MSREITRIGVVGLGTMGAGIAEVFARSGYDVIGLDANDDGGRARSRPRRGLDRARGQARQAHRGGARRDHRPDPLHHRLRRPRRPRPRRRGRAGEPRPQARDLRAARQGRRGRRDPRDATPPSLSVTEIAVATARPAAGRRHALLQPGAGAEASSRSSAPSSPSPDVVDDVQARRAEPRQAAGRRRRQGRLHRQRAAVRLPQPRRVDVRDEVRHPRGHRRRDEARLRPARWVRSRCST